MPVTPAVPYMSTGLAGCSVGPGISRGAHKLARTSRVIKKKIIIKKKNLARMSSFLFLYNKECPMHCLPLLF